MAKKSKKPHHPRKKPQTGRVPPGDGRFLLERLLGAGGVCEVYAALDLHRVEWGDANPRVAVKRLRPELNDSAQARLALAQEFCVLRHLAHPGVVRVFDLHKEPFGICCSMELLQGRTLQQEMLRQPSGQGLAAVRLGAALFGTMAFLHAQGVTHGDIKPSNVFLAPEGRTALIDFNVAMVTARVGAASAPVAQGLRESLRLPSYSLRYASPERLRGGRPSPSDDVFAACCTVYEAMAGAHPFGRCTALEAMEARLSPGRPAGVSPGQWALLYRGLSFDPARRPQADMLWDRFTRTRFLIGLKDVLCC
jgi:serine/threonine-protein kinase Stk1